MTTVYTQTHLDNLDEAIANGHLRVRYADKEVTYRSIDEMLKIRSHIARQLGQTTSTSGRILTNFDKGLYASESDDFDE